MQRVMPNNKTGWFVASYEIISDGSRSAIYHNCCIAVLKMLFKVNVSIINNTTSQGKTRLRMSTFAYPRLFVM